MALPIADMTEPMSWPAALKALTMLSHADLIHSHAVFIHWETSSAPFLNHLTMSSQKTMTAATITPSSAIAQPTGPMATSQAAATMAARAIACTPMITHWATIRAEAIAI